MGGFTGGTVLFCLDVRAEYTAQETSNIAKYKLGKEVIYNSAATKRHLDSAGAQLDRTQSGGAGEFAAGLARGALSIALSRISLHITIDSLGRGQHIECKDLPELMEAEEAVMQACRNVRDYLNLAATFNGSTILVDFSDKSEQVHTAMGGAVYAPPPASVAPAKPPIVESRSVEPTAAADLGPLTPSDVAQMQFGNMEEATAEFERKVRQLVSEHKLAFLIGGLALGSIFVLLLYGFAAFALFSVAAFFGVLIFQNNRRR